jgi:hypothetical protein
LAGASCSHAGCPSTRCGTSCPTDLFKNHDLAFSSQTHYMAAHKPPGRASWSYRNSRAAAGASGVESRWRCGCSRPPAATNRRPRAPAAVAAARSVATTMVLGTGSTSLRHPRRAMGSLRLELAAELGCPRRAPSPPEMGRGSNPLTPLSFAPLPGHRRAPARRQEPPPLATRASSTSALLRGR